MYLPYDLPLFPPRKYIPWDLTVSSQENPVYPGILQPFSLSEPQKAGIRGNLDTEEHL